MVARAANHHGLYICFGCAAPSLPDMCPPQVSSLVSTPTQMTQGNSRDSHTSSKHDQVVRGCGGSSDLSESVNHVSSLPLKLQRHAPQELYTVPDWNSPPKPITRALDSPWSAASGFSPPTCWPLPRPTVNNLYLRNRGSLQAPYPQHLDLPGPLLELRLARTIDGRTSTPT